MADESNRKPGHPAIVFQELHSLSESGKKGTTPEPVPLKIGTKLYGITKSGIPIVDATGQPDAFGLLPTRSVRPQDCLKR
jgi:hypothetical protein